MQSIDVNNVKDCIYVETSLDGKTLWINVDGTCIMRINRIPKDVFIQMQLGSTTMQTTVVEDEPDEA